MVSHVSFSRFARLTRGQKVRKAANQSHAVVFSPRDRELAGFEYWNNFVIRFGHEVETRCLRARKPSSKVVRQVGQLLQRSLPDHLDQLGSTPGGEQPWQARL